MSPTQATPATPAPPRRPPSFCRRWFRRCRIVVLLLMIGILGAVLYFNRVGLPDWLKTEVLAELGRRGADVRFSRLRWHGTRGFVADNVFVRRTHRPRDPVVQISQLQFNLNWNRLLHDRRFELESCRIADGRLAIPIEPPGADPEFFNLENVNATLRAPDPNQWQLDDFRAAFLGAAFRASGVLTNALHLRPKATGTPPAGDTTAAEFWRTRLLEFVRTCKRMQFSEPPEFRLRFQGDASDLNSCTVEFRASIAGARSPWANLNHLTLAADLNSPPPTNDVFNVALKLEAAAAKTPWGQFERARLTARSIHLSTQALPVSLTWDLNAVNAHTPYGQFDQARIAGRSEPDSAQPGQWRSQLVADATGLSADWGTTRTNHINLQIIHSLTNAIPSHAELAASFDQLATPWATAARFETSLHLEPRPPPSTPSPAATNHPLPFLDPFAISGSVAATTVRAQGFQVDRLNLDARWTAPSLVLNNVQARLSAGSLDLPEARLDLESGAVSLQADAALDARAFAPQLGRGVESFLRQFDWNPTHPPRVHATARAVLPAWTNAAPDWKTEVLPTLTLQAAVAGENAAYRGVPVQQANLNVSVSNGVLRLRDFHVVRPEGDGDLAYTLNLTTREFRWQLRCNLDPVAVAPAIDDRAPAAAALFSFDAAASAAGTVWGRWGPNRELNLDLQVLATNFTFRGQPVTSLAAALLLTNRFLTATGITYHDPAQSITVPSIGFGLDDQIVRIQSAEGRMDPMRIARAIGTNVIRILEPYRFDNPIEARVTGAIPTHGSLDAADLEVDFKGGPFHYWRFNLSHLNGHLHWQGDAVILTNVAGGFYDGSLNGDVRIRLRPDATADFAFRATIAEADASPLLADTVTTTNHITGRLGGTLEIVQANSSDWKSWNGVGTINLHHGMLWDLPIFSILSTVLNAVAPGLGNSKATAARGSFLVLDSVMQTDDLEIVADPARLQYRGTLDFDWNVRARVEAEILPGAPLVGPLLNILFLPVTKALVYRVTGTLGHPELDPVYIPKFLLPILRPWHTLKSVVPGANKPGR